MTTPWPRKRLPESEPREQLGHERGIKWLKVVYIHWLVMLSINFRLPFWGEKSIQHVALRATNYCQSHNTCVCLRECLVPCFALCPKRTSKHEEDEEEDEEDEEEDEEHEYHQDYARTISIKLPITLRYTNIAVEIHVFPGKWSTNGASSMETFQYQRVKSHKFYIWCLNQLTIPWITTFSSYFAATSIVTGLVGSVSFPPYTLGATLRGVVAKVKEAKLATTELQDTTSKDIPQIWY